MTRRALAVLPLVILAAGGAAEAADPRIVIEAASTDAFCPPCRRVVLLGAPAGATGTLTVHSVPVAGDPPTPWTQPLGANPGGTAEGWFPVPSPGIYIVRAEIGGVSFAPSHTVVDCGPPWQPPAPPDDCPPPSPWRTATRDAFTTILRTHRGQTIRVVLEQLLPGPPPRWLLVRSKTKTVTVDADGNAKVSTEGIAAGVYRVRFVDGKGRTIASPIAEIPRKP